MKRIRVLNGCVYVPTNKDGYVHEAYQVDEQLCHRRLTANWGIEVNEGNPNLDGQYRKMPIREENINSSVCKVNGMAEEVLFSMFKDYMFSTLNIYQHTSDVFINVIKRASTADEARSIFREEERSHYVWALDTYLFMYERKVNL